ncbi:hypothetical protein CYLTODRAFT_427174 [Cylindrobasidium torrendii FP15055 ss-10]|uniref:Bromodomain-containing protein n=1 Tax=Cylindrobasidium torrendii FP15055 ss-10 TaxID=1314674 RepID=A0A0D7AVQ9_9AGAR|nr:hypothetical protein CYLTODRAFT_427174 [Cylindrobasidium torrendii FP15055 ss-10]
MAPRRGSKHVESPLADVEVVFQPKPKGPPVAVFEKTVENLPTGVQERGIQAFGFNDGSSYRRPDHYVRHTEPLEHDLASQVEYDLDEQDEQWLLSVNAERKQQALNPVSTEVFEIIMDRLEKEFFQLSKHVPRPDLENPGADAPCAICTESEVENANAIIFCDGCNLVVHQACYGVPYIPEGQWLCRKCVLSPNQPVNCILCPNEGGAYKQTTHGEWVHLVCAMWTPGVEIMNEKVQEPIDVSRLDPARERLVCIVCNIHYGYPAQCLHKVCEKPYHVTCARKWQLINPSPKDPNSLGHFCPTHLAAEYRELHAEARIKAEKDDRKAFSSKSARAHSKTYKPAPPVIPWIIIDRITQYTGRISIRKRQEFICDMARYWSLKREARRGAPLLKRLQAEAWPNNTGLDTKELKQMKLEALKKTRTELQHARDLAELGRKRESRKLNQTLLLQKIVTDSIYPHEALFRSTFLDIRGHDRTHHFVNPVSSVDFPEYYKVVEKPMCWKYIQEKLDRHEYWQLDMFKADIDLVWKNAKAYYNQNTAQWRTADRIESHIAKVFGALQTFVSEHPPLQSEDNPSSYIGDIEPPIEVLDLLFRSELVKDLDLEYDIGDTAPLMSLFDFEFGTPQKTIVAATPKRSQKASIKNRIPAEELEPVAQNPSSSSHKRRRVPNLEAIRTTVDADAVEKVAKTPQSVPWEQSPLPMLADDVSKKEAFLHFDSGWVLPAGAKRNRKVSEPTPAEAVRKSTKKSGGGRKSANGKSDGKRRASSSIVPQTPVDSSSSPPFPSVSAHAQYTETDIDVDDENQDMSMQVDMESRAIKLDQGISSPIQSTMLRDGNPSIDSLSVEASVEPEMSVDVEGTDAQTENTPTSLTASSTQAEDVTSQMRPIDDGHASTDTVPETPAEPSSSLAEESMVFPAAVSIPTGMVAERPLSSERPDSDGQALPVGNSGQPAANQVLSGMSPVPLIQEEMAAVPPSPQNNSSLFAQGEDYVDPVPVAEGERTEGSFLTPNDLGGGDIQDVKIDCGEMQASHADVVMTGVSSHASVEESAHLAPEQAGSTSLQTIAPAVERTHLNVDLESSRSNAPDIPSTTSTSTVIVEDSDEAPNDPDVQRQRPKPLGSHVSPEDGGAEVFDGSTNAEANATLALWTNETETRLPAKQPQTLEAPASQLSLDKPVALALPEMTRPSIDPPSTPFVNVEAVHSPALAPIVSHVDSRAHALPSAAISADHFSGISRSASRSPGPARLLQSALPPPTQIQAPGPSASQVAASGDLITDSPLLSLDQSSATQDDERQPDQPMSPAPKDASLRPTDPTQAPSTVATQPEDIEMDATDNVKRVTGQKDGEKPDITLKGAESISTPTPANNTEPETMDVEATTSIDKTAAEPTDTADQQDKADASEPESGAEKPAETEEDEAPEEDEGKAVVTDGEGDTEELSLEELQAKYPDRIVTKDAKGNIFIDQITTAKRVRPVRPETVEATRLKALGEFSEGAIQPGVFVWAKQGLYPYYAGQVIAADDPEWKAVKSKPKNWKKMHVVKYGGDLWWSALPSKNVLQLGVNKELDDAMLALSNNVLQPAKDWETTRPKIQQGYEMIIKAKEAGDNAGAQDAPKKPARKGRKSKAEEEAEVDGEEEVAEPAKKKRGGKARKSKATVDDDDDEEAEEAEPVKPVARKGRSKAAQDDNAEDEAKVAETTPSATKRGRKPKAVEAEDDDEEPKANGKAKAASAKVSAKGKARGKKADNEEDEEAQPTASAPRGRRKAAKSQKDGEDEEEAKGGKASVSAPAAAKGSGKRKRNVEVESEEEVETTKKSKKSKR